MTACCRKSPCEHPGVGPCTMPSRPRDLDKRMKRLVQTMRMRANSGVAAHGTPWAEGVRFAANLLAAELASSPPKN